MVFKKEINLESVDADLIKAQALLKGLQDKRKSLMAESAKAEHMELIKCANAFAEMFEKGAVKVAYDEIQASLERLNSYDEGYKGQLSGDRYGAEPTEYDNFWAQLFGSSFRLDAKLFQVLEQLSSWRNMEPNPFVPKRSEL